MKIRKTQIFRAFYAFLPVGVALTCGVFLAYALAQQVLRQDANDPQVQMAEDAAGALSHNMTPAFFAQSGAPVALENSLAPYVIVTNATGAVTRSTGVLHGASPTLPIGVLQAAKTTGENRVTWQPEPGVRQAVVVVPYHSSNGDGFVIAGRSLREVGRREDALARLAVMAWFVGILVLALACFCAGLVPPSFSTRSRE